MAQLRKIELGILNIKTHPHNATTYVNLFQSLFNIDRPAPIRGSVWGLPNFISEITPGKPEEGLFGSFYKFTQINPNEPWLDIKKRKRIVDENGEAIPQVEDNKKPNSKEIEFAFYPQGHLFFFNCKLLSHGYAQKLFQNLCNRDEIKAKFGVVDVEIVSSAEAIERILKIPSLTRLDITFSRPNADVISGKKREILEKMERQKVRRLNQEMLSEKGEGILPDEDTLALMDLATTNGKVFAIGYDGDTKIEESTDPYPEIIRGTFNPDQTSLLRTLIDYSSDALSRFIARG